MSQNITTSHMVASFLDLSPKNVIDIDLHGVSTLGNIRPNTVTFLSKPTPERIAILAETETTLVLVPADSEDNFPFPHLAIPNPRLAMAAVMREFFSPKIVPGTGKNTHIHETAEIGNNVHIGHFTIIGENVKIGDNTFIGNNVEIFRNVTIGENCHIKSQAVIGEEGFGFEKDEDGNYQRLPHIGGVILDDFIELGSHSTIASGTIEPSRVGSYTKIDDHAHIGHNCNLGRNNIIAGGVIISGSVTTEDDVWFGPNCSMMQGLKFHEGCVIGVGAVMYSNGKAFTSYGPRPSLPAMKRPS